MLYLWVSEHPARLALGGRDDTLHTFVVAHREVRGGFRRGPRPSDRRPLVPFGSRPSSSALSSWWHTARSEAMYARVGQRLCVHGGATAAKTLRAPGGARAKGCAYHRLRRLGAAVARGGSDQGLRGPGAVGPGLAWGQGLQRPRAVEARGCDGQRLQRPAAAAAKGCGFQELWGDRAMQARVAVARHVGKECIACEAPRRVEPPMC